MAHFAKIENGIVHDVIVVSNDDAPTEQAGQEFIASIGLTGEWVQTSYNHNFRHKYAGIGDSWNGAQFISPQPYPSWTLDENFDWQPPTPKPPGNYAWFEPNLVWIEIVEP